MFMFVCEPRQSWYKGSCWIQKTVLVWLYKYNSSVLGCYTNPSFWFVAMNLTFFYKLVCACRWCWINSLNYSKFVMFSQHGMKRWVKDYLLKMMQRMMRMKMIMKVPLRLLWELSTEKQNSKGRKKNRNRRK